MLSLFSGTVSLAVSLILWWQSGTREVVRLAEQAEFFSAAVGLTLAGIALASPRKRVRRLAIAAVIVNIAILSFVLDKLFAIVRS